MPSKPISAFPFFNTVHICRSLASGYISFTLSTSGVNLGFDLNIFPAASWNTFPNLPSIVYLSDASLKLFFLVPIKDVDTFLPISWGKVSIVICALFAPSSVANLNSFNLALVVSIICFSL